MREVILDGEITWGKAGMAYHVFDILWLDGRDVMSLPLDERRALLEACRFAPPLQRVDELDGSRPWERACSEGWEGVIAKRRDSPYEHRRSPHWLKMKCEATQELVVGGFTDPQGGRVGLGALLVGYFEKEDFVFAGKVGTGFDTKLLLDLRARLDALEIAEAAVHQSRRTAAPPRALGASRDRRDRSRSSNGPSTASFAIRGCSACARNSEKTRHETTRAAHSDVSNRGSTSSHPSVVWSRHSGLKLQTKV